MADEPQALLGKLCTICRTDTPKYCCPRCKTETCSLACCKTHKLWSQCSGKRDPTIYVPKSKLCTPAGIDHDFNFVTGIERGIATAARNLEQNGITLKVGQERKLDPGSKLQRSVNETGIVIHRAPQGMSRNKNNHTQWHNKQKCIRWTIEWVFPDGTRNHASCRDNMPVAEGYTAALEQRPGTKKRKRGNDEQKDRHNRVRDINLAADPYDPITKDTFGSDRPLDILQTTLSSPIMKEEATVLSPIIKEEPTVLNPIIKAESTLLNPILKDESTLLDPVIKLEYTTEGGQIFSDAFPDSATLSDPVSPIQTTITDPMLYFYLHKPFEPGRDIVLIPVQGSTTLSSALRKRVVHEYPTIYIMHHSPSDLPQGFRLHKDGPPMIQEL